MYVVTFDEKNGNRKLEIVEHTEDWVRGVFSSKDFAKCERACQKIRAFVAAKTKVRANSLEFEEALNRFSRREIEQLFPYVYMPASGEMYSPEGAKYSPHELIEGEDYIVRDAYSHEWYWLKGVSYGGEEIDYQKALTCCLIYSDQITNLGAEELVIPDIFLQ